ncbi:MAG: Holliday junction resolvase RuvX [Anaerolineae bacterium]
MKGRLLGIDHGLARIGLAVSDASGLIARELSILKRTTRAADFAYINRAAVQEGVVGVVVGVPLGDAPEGTYTQADRVRLWIERYRQTTHLPVVEWDETLTSHDAQALSRALKRPMRAPVDDLAARLMLQSFLDAVRDGLASWPTLDQER